MQLSANNTEYLLMNGLNGPEDGGLTPTPSLQGDTTPSDDMQVTDIESADERMEVEEVGPDLPDLLRHIHKCEGKYCSGTYINVKVNISPAHT